MSQIQAASRPLLSAHVIFLRYVLFAVASSVINLATQEICVRLLPYAPLMAPVLAGTVTGFLAKYILEKRWIFLDDYSDHKSELRKFIVYGLFGVGTTLFFWAVELGAWHVWQTTSAKYVGAAIGLSLGNWIKYLLDRHYVFPRAPA